MRSTARCAVRLVLLGSLFTLTRNARAQPTQPTSRVIPFAGVATTIPPGTVGQPLTLELWDAAAGGNLVVQEAQTLDVDASGNIAFVLGAQTPQGLDPSKFSSGSSLFLDVVDATSASVLASGRLPLNAVAFALSPGPPGPRGDPGPPGAVQAVTAGDSSITVGGSSANPTVAVAPNGIGNAHVADGALSPSKIAGTVATLGANTFTGTQQVNAPVGIGTTPLFNLHVQNTGRVEARIQSTSLSGPAALSLSAPTLLGARVYSMEDNGTFGIVDRTANQTRMFIGINGGVGIGVATDAFLQGQLTVSNSGTAGVSGVAAFSNITNGIGVSGNGNGIGVLGVSNVAGGIAVSGSASNGALAGSFQGGNVGIGTTSPISRLHAQAGSSGAGLGSGNAIVGECNTGGCAGVVGSTLNGQAGLLGVANGAGGIAVQGVASNGALAGSFNGTVQMNVLSILGGADVAERFEVHAPVHPSVERQGSEIPPGMIVSIDPRRPGSLMISHVAYDRRVAGVISGAGGVRPGMVLGQSGSVADGDRTVALAGRVYCWADASNGPIRPGDLLTTSSRPGHAMKAADRRRAAGSIVGKALTGLDEGPGLILILVALR